MLAAVLGAGIGAAFLLGDWWSWPAATSKTGKEVREIVHSSSFVIWAALICAQTTLWTLAAAPVFLMLRRNRAGWRSQRRDIVISGLLLVALVVLMVVVTNLFLGAVPGPHRFNQVFPHQHVKVWASQPWRFFLPWAPRSRSG